MARIAGVNIPTNKRVVIALTYIHGIGPAKSVEICEAVGIAAERRVHDLTAKITFDEHIRINRLANFENFRIR